MTSGRVVCFLPRALACGLVIGFACTISWVRIVLSGGFEGLNFDPLENAARGP